MTDEDLIDYIANVNQRAAAIVLRGETCSFPAGDIRRSVLLNLGNALTHYGVALGAIHTLEAVACDGLLVHNYFVQGLIKLMFSNERKQTSGPTYREMHMRKLRAHVFHDTWSVFENGIRVLYLAVVPEDLRRADKEELSHVGIPRVWLRLSAEAKKSGETSKEERSEHNDLVCFCSAARNTVHSNTIYSGPAMRLVVGKRELQLQPGRPTDFLTAEIVLQLVDGLLGAFEFLSRNIKGHAKIADPIGAFPQSEDAVTQVHSGTI